MTIGLKAYLAIQLPVILIAGTVGIWLFDVQHQFEGTYWRRGEAWSYLDQALAGASFYRLPRLLQWLTGNIGLRCLRYRLWDEEAGRLVGFAAVGRQQPQAA